MNQFVLGPETRMGEPMPPDMLMAGLKVQANGEPPLMVVVPIEQINTEPIAEAPTPGIMNQATAHAHWRQARFHSEQLNGADTGPQLPISEALTHIHLAALGVTTPPTESLADILQVPDQLRSAA